MTLQAFIETLRHWWLPRDAPAQIQRADIDPPELRQRLLDLCERQTRHEMASGYDVNFGLIAIARAWEVIESVPLANDADAYLDEVVASLFVLLEHFRTHGPRGEHASAASSLGSLILAVGGAMQSLHPAAAEDIRCRFRRML
jgi:hypothetical protein